MTMAEHFRRMLSCFAGADPSGIVAPEYVDHQGQRTSGLDGFTAMAAALRAAFPDLRVDIEDLVADGDRVAVRLHWRGTFTAQFWGKPPTGQAIEVESFEIVRFANGLAVEHWGMSRGWP